MHSDIQLRSGDALLVVDMQNDFLPGGALPVTDGDAVIPALNHCIKAFMHEHLPLIFSRDWHPLDHRSFKGHGGHWPPHCIATSTGADFAAGLKVPESALIISKAASVDEEAYSAFENTELAQRLNELQIKRLFVGGLATDYCVRATVLDALATGFAVIVLQDAVRAVELKQGDGEHALHDMSSRGALLRSSHRLFESTLQHLTHQLMH
jgi:nicotinamidase/pyrazinamidase